MDQTRMAFETADAPLLAAREVRTITLLAVTGDRGLCGGYNANVIRRAERRIGQRGIAARHAHGDAIVQEIARRLPDGCRGR